MALAKRSREGYAGPIMPAILSIQSHVSYGHVGNAAAVFPLQRLGFEVWPVHTVLFSNHTGYGAWRGEVVRPDAIRAILAGIGERGVLAGCGAVLSGYLGDGALGAAVVEAVRAVKAANPAALWTCDPVMGDVGPGVFVREGLPDFFRERAVPAADIVTPNRFELELLTGMTARDLDGARGAARALLAQGPRIVLVTSLDRADRAEGSIEMLAVSRDEAWLIATPELAFPVAPNGSGDATAALFTGHYLETGDMRVALERTAAGIFAILDATRTSGGRELALVAAQDALARRETRFGARPV